MEGIIAIIIIIAALARLNTNAKKVRQNAPGQSRPPQSAEPTRPLTQSTRPVMQPTVQPTVKPIQPTGSFWGQMMDALEEAENEVKRMPQTASVKPAAAKKPATTYHKGHAAVGSLPEGTSRECDYGSLGGSMAYTHTDGAPAAQRKPVEKDAQAEEIYRPAMTAEEMRRAVVMAEILKRPQERMAEQARRWNLR